MNALSAGQLSTRGAERRPTDGVRQIGRRQDQDILFRFQFIQLCQDGVDHLLISLGTKVRLAD